MNEISEGTVVIVAPSGQAGTFIGDSKDVAAVLLRNGDLWIGKHHDMREPQCQEDLDAAPLEKDDRFEGR